MSSTHETSVEHRPLGDLFQSFRSEEESELAQCRPVSPAWNRKRPFLTGSHLWESEWLQTEGPWMRSTDSSSGMELGRVNNVPETLRLQEAALVDDLLNGFMGINGQFIKFEFPRNPSGGKEVMCILQPGLDPGLHSCACRVLPVCENVVILQQFVETRLRRECGLVCHAVAAALRVVLDDWLLLVTQLENLLCMGRLTMQSLWHYINPPSCTLKLLAKICREAASSQLMGRELLNFVHLHHRMSNGNRSAHTVLQKLLESASRPYFEILEKWLCSGVLDDPYGEFIIQENPRIGKMSTTNDLQSAYWHHRYTLRCSSSQPGSSGRMPNFLEEHEEMILTTGKYLSAMRDCGKPVRDLLSGGYEIKYDPGNQYVHQFHKAHETARAAFLEFFMKDLNLLEWLRGIKHFFLLDRGDLIGSLLDFTDEEFAKQPDLVSHTRMQSLLELAVRTSSIPQSADSTPLAFGFDSRTLLEMARSVFQKKAPASPLLRSRRRTEEDRKQAQDHTKDVKGYQVFTLSYRVDWPLTLVVAPKNMQQYQLLFRHMFLLRKTERDLGEVWQTLQISRRLPSDGQIGVRAREVSLICHKMLHIFQQYAHYITVDTVEPLWNRMEMELAKSKDIDSVIGIHQEFVSKVLRHSLLYKPKVVSLVEKLEEHAMHFIKLVMEAIKPSGDIPGPVSNPRSASDRHARLSLDRLNVEKALTNEGFNWEAQKTGLLFTHKVNELIRELTEVYDSSTSDRSETGGFCLESEEVMKLHGLIEGLNLCG